MLKINNLLYGIPVDGPWLAAKSLCGRSLIHSMQHRVQTLFFPLPDCSILRTSCLLAASITDYIYIYIYLFVYTLCMSSFGICVLVNSTQIYGYIWVFVRWHLFGCFQRLSSFETCEMWEKKALSNILKEHCPKHWCIGKWIRPQCKATSYRFTN